MACRGRCGHFQMCFDAFVMGFPKTDFSVCVVFFLNAVLDRLVALQ